MCARSKTTPYKYGLEARSLHHRNPREKLAMDISGPFDFATAEENSVNEKVFFITIIDCCDRTVMIKKTFRITSQTICEALEHWIKEKGTPSTFITDQGRQFMSERFQQYLKEVGIRHRPTSPYSPQGNGLVERINHTIGNVVKCYRDRSLSEIEKIANNSLNLSYHRHLGLTPQEAHNKYSIWDPLKKKIVVDWNLIAERNEERSLHEFNAKKYRKRFTFEPGQDCYVRNMLGNKLQDKYTGPFRILQVSPTRSRLLIEAPNCQFWTNVRHVKPRTREGRRCRMSYNDSG